MPNRIDFNIISGFIDEGARVLDLGCGDGELLLKLERERNVTGEGIEISEDGIRECISKGLVVHHGDIDEGLDSYADGSFDYVILSATIQMTQHPLFVIREMLRVGHKAVVSVPNFGHWSMRLQLGRGRMPVTKVFPYRWYDTPNTRFSTIADFKDFCRGGCFHIEQAVYLKDFERTRSPFLANLLAGLGIFVLSDERRRPETTATDKR